MNTKATHPVFNRSDYFLAFSAALTLGLAALTRFFG